MTRTAVFIVINHTIGETDYYFACIPLPECSPGYYIMSGPELNCELTEYDYEV